MRAFIFEFSFWSRALAQFFHHRVEHFFSRTSQRVRQSRQRLIDHVQHVEEVGRLGVDVEDAGQDFAFSVGFSEAGHGLNLVRRVVVFFQFAQMQAGAVVHGDFDRCAGIVLDVDFFEVGDEADILQSLLVLFHVFVGFG